MVDEQPISRREAVFHPLLETLADHVYYQEPVNVQMVYPCIRYEIDAAETEFADNLPYRRTKRYSVTVMDYDPDSPLAEAVATLPMCVFDRRYPADNLNHFVFTIYF